MAVTTLIGFAIFTTAVAQTVDKAVPPGSDETAKTKLLEAGAKVLQGNQPLDSMDVYLVGFHPMKDDPEHQMEAHHFCNQVNQDFAQCVLFDGNEAGSNLNGVEYIISQSLFDELPDDEKKYWHPHNGEILSGQLIAPGIPDVAEKQLMKDKMNSYGKTWHFWQSAAFGMTADKLPLGEPMLAWSFNRDGEAIQALIEQRDQRLGVRTDETRDKRRDLVELAKPQSGVDALKDAFSHPTSAIPGVTDQDHGTSP
ncbi:outer membrane or secreted lipoprotein [Pollutimonas subterranea]|uniref:Outer membrane or secreted lipoprotein n=2 Tax=Pollutimonas subterranea TaxID=2045210 RepID=A0A2N4U282_9BURK|nr:outer membrane or secreted lipoprotein [Pollutimonas subterranea]